VVNERLQFRPGELVVDVSRSGSAEYGGGLIEWTRRRVRDWKRTLAVRAADCELFDAAKLGNRVMLRHWHPGDRFQALGMCSASKLQDWFVNQKVPAVRRRQLVLAAAAGGVLCWVEGQRVAEPFKLNGQTREVLVWRWRRTAGEWPVATAQ
jgi:tRNA(Ile)-lysidine synthetase-like protein